MSERSIKNNRDDEKVGQTQVDVDLKLDEAIQKDEKKNEAKRKPSRTKATEKEKTKPSKAKNKSLFNALADKILGKSPKVDEKEKKKSHEKKNRTDCTTGGLTTGTTMTTKEGEGGGEPAELPKNVKEYITSVLEIEKTQTLNKYFLNTLIKISQPPATFPSFNANMNKNQSSDVFCNEANRVKLPGPAVSPSATATTADYIHANYVKFEGLKRTYIATQHPLKTTVEDFYAMCFAEEVDTIVSLSGASEAFPNYFPVEKDGFINLSRYSISCKFMKAESKNRPAEYTLDVLPTGCSNSVVVKLVKYSNWGKYQVPGSPKVISALLKAVKKSRGPLVVQCETGVNQTAAFIFIDATLGLLDAGASPTLESVFKELKAQRHSALSQRLHFSYAVFATLVVLRHRATRANQHADCLKAVESFEKDMATEYAKSTKPSEPDDPKASSKDESKREP